MSDQYISVILIVFGLISVVLAIVVRAAVSFGYGLSSLSQVMAMVEQLFSPRNNSPDA